MTEPKSFLGATRMSLCSLIMVISVTLSFGARPVSAAPSTHPSATPPAGKSVEVRSQPDPNEARTVGVRPVEPGGSPVRSGGSLGPGQESSMGMGIQFKFAKPKSTEPEPEPSSENPHAAE